MNPILFLKLHKANLLPRVESERGTLRIRPVVLCARELPATWRIVPKTLLREPWEPQ